MLERRILERFSAFGRRAVRDPRMLLSRLQNYSDERQILEELKIFAPASAGHFRDLAKLTVQSAEATVPLLAELGELSGKLPPPEVDIEAFSKALGETDHAVEIGGLFEKYGSDKTALGYHHLYGALLADRGGTAPVVEVGIGTNYADTPSTMGRSGKPGASLRAFQDYFEEAPIVGADIDPRILFSEGRIRTVWVDQTAPSSFAELRQHSQGFRILIDDGLHSPAANLVVLLFGLPLLREGSWIVIEDIGFDSRPVWQLVSLLLPKDVKSHLVRTERKLLFCVTRRAANRGASEA